MYHGNLAHAVNALRKLDTAATEVLADPNIQYIMKMADFAKRCQRLSDRFQETVPAIRD